MFKEVLINKEREGSLLNNCFSDKKLIRALIKKDLLDNDFYYYIISDLIGCYIQDSMDNYLNKKINKLLEVRYEK